MSAKTPSDPSHAPVAAGPDVLGPSDAARPLWEIAAAIGATVPDAAWRRVPADLGKRVGHYLYGRRPVRDAGRRRRLRNFAIRRRMIRALAPRRRSAGVCLLPRTVGGRNRSAIFRSPHRAPPRPTLL